MPCFPHRCRHPILGARPREYDPEGTPNSIPERPPDFGAPASIRRANSRSANHSRQESDGWKESQQLTRLPAKRPVLYAGYPWTEDEWAYLLLSVGSWM